MRKGDYVFLGLALFFIVSHFIVFGMIIEGTLEYDMVGAIIQMFVWISVYVGIPWLVYNWWSNKRQKNKITI